ncbi:MULTISPECIES: lipopolysaccharide assembly protein LapB [unclassified Duganella]|uniref:tetratricopeptide repeat protein n=1 Tax=unclassified Duganella TaxID=2636909 RepID=UPI0006F2A750|nr:MULTISPECIES: hypothetical protein [unclassified Duganella]KQV58004.1 hypothetical protein ASD07_26520 [Duganella sp. Root336D2]KRB99145.1 hypothetical protein ASE26_24630 [Duganella sp. Root198D2]
MSNSILAGLDQAELLQLALKAGAGNEAGSAIAYLKEAVGRPDATAQAHYLLGAEYAQLGMYDRAAGEMEAAIALDQTLYTARLQLALLWLGASQAERAAGVLRPLEESGVPAELQHFGHGLLLLIADDLAGARTALAQGIELNHANPPLNDDMQRIIGELDSRIAAAGAAAPADSTGAEADGDGQHLLLSAYAGNFKH